MNDKKKFGHTIKQFLSRSQNHRKEKYFGEDLCKNGQELTLYTAYLLKEEEGKQKYIKAE